MEKASEVYLHSKRNDAMDNENIILSLCDKIIEGVKSEENQHYFYSIFFGQKEKRFLKSREDRPEPFSLSQWKDSNQLYLTLGWTTAVGIKVPMAAKWSGDEMFYF